MDLNADLAESFGRWQLGDDDGLLGIVTSANVACGFHAGDPRVMRRACRLAAERGVTIGAHVGYRDLAGFGRRYLDMDPDELTDEIVYQLGALVGIARIAGTDVTYVKPHGALYNALAGSEAQASAVLDAILQFDSELAVLGLAGSSWLERAEAAGLAVFHEAFADRAYTPDGALVSRRAAGAVISDPEVIARRCVGLTKGEPIEAVDGSMITVHADSICVHGDSAGAVAIAGAVRDALVDEGITLSAFAPPSRVVMGCAHAAVR